MSEERIEIAPGLMGAPAADEPCELYTYHQPVPIRTQGHHTRPQYLQRRLWGEVRDETIMWLCGTCHDSVHETLAWLLGEGRVPNPSPGRYVLAEAQRTLDWYRAEQQALIQGPQVPGAPIAGS